MIFGKLVAFTLFNKILCEETKVNKDISEIEVSKMVWKNRLTDIKAKISGVTADANTVGTGVLSTFFNVVKNASAQDEATMATTIHSSNEFKAIITAARNDAGIKGLSYPDTHGYKNASMDLNSIGAACLDAILILIDTNGKLIKNESGAAAGSTHVKAVTALKDSMKTKTDAKDIMAEMLPVIKVTAKHVSSQLKTGGVDDNRNWFRRQWEDHKKRSIAIMIAIGVLVLGIIATVVYFTCFKKDSGRETVYDTL